jgi:hypothetical protein
MTSICKFPLSQRVRMNMRNDVVEMTEALPLALLNLRAKIATAKDLHPERLGTLHARYCCVMKLIRAEKDLPVEELSALSGLSENFLQAAELANLNMTDDDIKALQGVYWELAIGEDNPGDFKRLANERLATPYPEVGSRCAKSVNRRSLVSSICPTCRAFLRTFWKERNRATLK